MSIITTDAARATAAHLANINAYKKPSEMFALFYLLFGLFIILGDVKIGLGQRQVRAGWGPAHFEESEMAVL